MRVLAQSCGRASSFCCLSNCDCGLSSSAAFASAAACSLAALDCATIFAISALRLKRFRGCSETTTHSIDVHFVLDFLTPLRFQSKIRVGSRVQTTRKGSRGFPEYTIDRLVTRRGSLTHTLTRPTLNRTSILRLDAASRLA